MVCPASKSKQTIANARSNGMALKCMRNIVAGKAVSGKRRRSMAADLP
jgi:hypothetical protein